MSSQHDKSATPPIVDPIEYEEPPTTEQNTWIKGANLIILVLAVIFVAVIIIYVLTR